jgi:hypothetical protein
VHDGQRVGRSIEGGVRCRKVPHPNRRAEGVAVAGEGVAVAGEERRLHLGGIDPAAAQRGARVGGEDGGEMARGTRGRVVVAAVWVVRVVALGRW